MLKPLNDLLKFKPLNSSCQPFLLNSLNKFVEPFEQLIYNHYAAKDCEDKNMNNYSIEKMEALSRERIIYLIDHFCDGNRMEFVRRTGINKSSVSQYVNGTNSPGNITAAKIGSAFNVDPMWVMGFDVPMDRTEAEKYRQNEKLIVTLQEYLGRELSRSDYEFIELFLNLPEDTKNAFKQIVKSYSNKE